MISFDEAVELIRSAAKPLGSETVRIEAAAGRVLASPVTALIDSPRSDVSAMDGYAVRDADLRRASLRVVGESFAGRGWTGEVGPGECARIFTGAPVPRGADRIVIQENVRREGEIAVIEQAAGEARYVRKRGSDFAAGDELLPTGRGLDPRAIVAAAAADVAELQVFRAPRLHIVATGDELAEPGQAASRDDAVPDSASLGVAALTVQWGAELLDRTQLGDDLSSMQSAAEKVVDAADVVVVTGGASVGEKDFAKAMFEPLGLELVFSKVAIKPGKPVWLGRTGSALIVGLPGNPTSALVTARLILAPLLAAMTGRPIEQALGWRTMSLSSPLPACGSRETFHRARVTGGHAEVLPYQESHAQKALAEADILVRQRADSPALTAGAAVEVLDF